MPCTKRKPFSILPTQQDSTWHGGLFHSCHKDCYMSPSWQLSHVSAGVSRSLSRTLFIPCGCSSYGKSSVMPSCPSPKAGRSQDYSPKYLQYPLHGALPACKPLNSWGQESSSVPGERWRRSSTSALHVRGNPHDFHLHQITQNLPLHRLLRKEH